jgi:hypothetical protein
LDRVRIDFEDVGEFAKSVGGECFGEAEQLVENSI